MRAASSEATPAPGRGGVVRARCARQGARGGARRRTVCQPGREDGVGSTGCGPRACSCARLAAHAPPLSLVGAYEGRRVLDEAVHLRLVQRGGLVHGDGARALSRPPAGLLLLGGCQAERSCGWEGGPRTDLPLAGLDVLGLAQPTEGVFGGGALHVRRLQRGGVSADGDLVVAHVHGGDTDVILEVHANTIEFVARRGLHAEVEVARRRRQLSAETARPWGQHAPGRRRGSGVRSTRTGHRPGPRPRPRRRLLGGGSRGHASRGWRRPRAAARCCPGSRLRWSGGGGEKAARRGEGGSGRRT